MKIYIIAFVVAVLSCVVFVSMSYMGPDLDSPQFQKKVELDLSELNRKGLRGLGDEQSAMSYEFAIPYTPACLEQVKLIDPTTQFYPGSPGRVGAKREQCLCIGSTQQKHYKSVLYALSELPYVERIIECHFK